MRFFTAFRGVQQALFIENFESHKNEFITDEILQTLKSNLEAISTKNKDQFVEGFLPGSADRNLFWITDQKQYRFIDIGTTSQNGKVISIPVKYQVNDNGDISVKNTIYTFLQDKDGTWKIDMID